MFFFKRKKIVVDCLTDNITAYEFHPIAKAATFIPEWFKELPAYVPLPSQDGSQMLVDKSTIKRCAGFTDLYAKGYILPSWTDIQMSTANGNCNFFFAVPGGEPPADHHREFQYGEAFNNHFHVKILSPWFLKQNKFCEFVMQPVVWHNPTHWSDFTVLPGVVNFMHQHSSHINMFLEKNKHKIFIEVGTPLYQIIPLTEDEVIFKNHLVDKKEIDRLNQRRYGSINNVYRNIKRSFKNKTSKCPFA